ncbi:choline transporter protein 1-like [Andrographis paniculata]|uniref:choline transporter protein 1-like n=1 Tax=Andrographis paniculata TaxID=175694 RepID=UPI0021E80E27|nr:choline transporter protein 1-like [Andrographis paniculata]
MSEGPLRPVLGRYPSSDGADGGTTKGGINDVIKHNRKCRDVVFLVLFVAFWVAMIVNSSFGFNRGDPLRLTYSLDYKGNVCGDKHANPDLRQLQLRYFMNPNEVYQTGVKDTKFHLSSARSICLMSCPVPSEEDSLNWVCDYPDGEVRLKIGEWIDRNYNYFADLTPELRNTSLQLQGPCYPVIFPSVNVYWTCQLIARASNVSMKHWEVTGGVKVVEDISIDKSIHKSINSRSSVLKRYVADVGKSWPVLLVCGGFLPLFLSLLWLLMIRYFVSGMPWITVVVFNLLMVSVTMFYYLKAGWIGDDAVTPIIGKHDPYYSVSARELHHLQVAAVSMTVLTIVAFLSSIAIVRRILKATSVLKVAAKVIGEVRALIIFPVIPYAILAIFYMFWLSAALHLFSSGSVVRNDCDANCCAYDLKAMKLNCDSCCGYNVRYTSHIAAAIVFHLFGAYWATQFFIASSSTVIAGSVASYYWTRGQVSPKIPFLPVFASMKRLARYSLGSVALGSLIVSFVESIRFILEGLRRRLKNVDSMPQSWIEKAMYRTSQGCLKCIVCIIKSVNRNAYIMIAITGKGFCRASEIATDLIMSNILRIGKVNVIGDAILFLGKLCVSLTSEIFAFLMLDTYKYKSSHNKISSPLFPALVCWCFGYIVATLFFGVVEMSVDTIILSFCQDSDEHQGAAQYAPPLLLQTFDDDDQNEKQRLMQ